MSNLLTFLARNGITITVVAQYHADSTAHFFVWAECSRCGDKQCFFKETSLRYAIRQAFWLRDVFNDVGVGRECSKHNRNFQPAFFSEN